LSHKQGNNSKDKSNRSGAREERSTVVIDGSGVPYGLELEVLRK